MKSLRWATRACSTVAYQAITASNWPVLSTTWANFCGAIRAEDAGSVRVSVDVVGMAVLQLGAAKRVAVATHGLGLMLDVDVTDQLREVEPREDRAGL